MHILEKVGILVVSYGAREVAIVNQFSSSQNYETEIFVVDKQKNPLNMKLAEEHVVVSDLSVKKICKFAARRQNKIDFGIVGSEKPIINGIRDVFEEETEIPMIRLLYLRPDREVLNILDTMKSGRVLTYFDMPIQVLWVPALQQIDILNGLYNLKTFHYKKCGQIYY